MAKYAAKLERLRLVTTLNNLSEPRAEKETQIYDGRIALDYSHAYTLHVYI